jgi:ADP-heptose:LPS heptosyltransferase
MFGPRKTPIRLTTERPRLLVFRNGMVGNTLMATPVFRALKQRFPGSFLGVVVDAMGKSLLAANPFVDEFFVFNRKKDSLGRQIELVRLWRSRRFDVSLHLRSGVRNEMLALAAGIPIRVGTKLRGSPQFLSHVLPKIEDLHVLKVAERFLAETFGETLPLHPPELFPNPAAGAEVERFLAERGLARGRFLVVHPAGESHGKLVWGMEHHPALAEHLWRRLGLPSVFVGAPHEQAYVAERLPQSEATAHYFPQPIDLISELIARAAALFGNDSGPAHMAEAWGVPKVVVYADRGEVLTKWAPVNPERALILFREEFSRPETFERIADWLAARIAPAAPGA